MRYLKTYKIITDVSQKHRLFLYQKSTAIWTALIQKHYKLFLGKTLLKKGYSPNPFPKTLNDFLTPMVLSIGVKK